MNNSDYQGLKQKFNKRIIISSYFLFLLIAMVLVNAAFTVLKMPNDIDAIRIIIPDILFSYGFNLIKNEETIYGIVMLGGFVVILAVLILLAVFAFKHKRWAFGWTGLFVFADLPLLIIVRNWQSIIVHLVLIAVCIYGLHICGANSQLDKRMWTF